MAQRDLHGGNISDTTLHSGLKHKTSSKDTAMILATVRLILPSQKRDEALKILRSAAEQCKVWPGCISCRVYGDLQEDNALMLEELWRSEEELEGHLRSDEYRNVLLVMEMAVREPEIRFDTISGSTGLETVQRVRSGLVTQ